MFNDIAHNAHHPRRKRVKIATYNVRTLLKDEQVPALDKETIKQHEMGRDRARRSPKKGKKFHRSPKLPPAVALCGNNNNNNNNIFILYSAKSMYSSKRFTIKRCDIASLKLIRNVKCAINIQYSG